LAVFSGDLKQQKFRRLQGRQIKRQGEIEQYHTVAARPARFTATPPPAFLL
jgi:hypothetical protein